MDTEEPARALSPAELILQQKAEALQGLPRPGGDDGGILSQLLGNPFFTAVGHLSIQWKEFTNLVFDIVGLWSSRSRHRSSPCATRPQAWRGPDPAAHARRRGDQREGRLVPVVPTLDDHLPTITAQRRAVCSR